MTNDCKRDYAHRHPVFEYSPADAPHRDPHWRAHPPARRLSGSHQARMMPSKA
jgi:hypothetical protein